MGMFDTITVYAPFPESFEEYLGRDFQTKAFDNGMDNYEITEDGRLICYYIRMEEVPEKERHYYGTPEWDEKPWVRSFGCMRAIPVGEAELKITLEFEFYTMQKGIKNSLIRFRARFFDGQLQSIRHVEEGEPWL